MYSVPELSDVTTFNLTVSVAWCREGGGSEGGESHVWVGTHAHNLSASISVTSVKR
jgi:hypothetical protein